jgi:flagellar basal-body rod protein FlgB
MKSLFEPHVNLVGRVMDMQLQRQNVVMSNVANVKTPGYKPLKVEFEEQLQAALNTDARGKLSRTNEHHMPGAFDPNSFGPEWEKAFKPRVVHGEDRVNLDKEMVIMAKNTLQYNTMTTVIKNNFEGLRTIIQEGSK